MKKILLAIALTLASSLTMATETGPWELVRVQKVFYIYICHYQRVITIDNFQFTNVTATTSYGTCTAPWY